MIDLTETIKKATAVEGLWSVQGFYSSLEHLQEFGIRHSHWTGEEDWATLFKDDLVIGYLWRRYPLVFFRTDKVSLIHGWQVPYPMVVLVSTEDLYQETFMISAELVPKLHLDGLNRSCFSAQDFWFFTSN